MNSMAMINDPTGGGSRGKVLRTRFFGGVAGDGQPRGGCSMRGDHEGFDIIYHAYQIYIPGFFVPKQLKIPGPISGLTYGHGAVSLDWPWLGTESICAQIQIQGATSGYWGSSTPDGIFGMYVYDANTVQGMLWANDIDPTVAQLAGASVWPYDQWVQVEIGVGMNSGDSANGWAGIWLNGVLKMKRTNRRWRWGSTHKNPLCTTYTSELPDAATLSIDGITLSFVTGGNNSTDPDNIPPSNLDVLLNDYIVSQSPITHVAEAWEA